MIIAYIYTGRKIFDAITDCAEDGPTGIAEFIHQTFENLPEDYVIPVLRLYKKICNSSMPLCSHLENLFKRKSLKREISVHVKVEASEIFNEIHDLEKQKLWFRDMGYNDNAMEIC